MTKRELKQLEIAQRVINQAFEISKILAKNEGANDNLGMINALLNPSEDETKVENIGGQVYITPQKSISDK